MIRFEGVSKSYDVNGARHVVLDDVSFTLPPRSRVGSRRAVKALYQDGIGSRVPTPERMAPAIARASASV